MKKIVVLIGLLYGLCTTGLAQQSFTISGSIKGLQVGDTLLFTPVLYPDKEVHRFYIVVEEKDTFFYKGAHAHHQCYDMVYKPLTPLETSYLFQGKRILITSGDLKINGIVNHIYASMLEGGVYDNPYLQKAYNYQTQLYSKKYDSYYNFCKEIYLPQEKEALRKKENEALIRKEALQVRDSSVIINLKFTEIFSIHADKAKTDKESAAILLEHKHQVERIQARLKEYETELNEYDTIIKAIDANLKIVKDKFEEDFTEEHREEYEHLDELWQEFDKNNPYSEYYYVRLLLKIKDIPSEEIQSIVDHVSKDNIKTGYYNSELVVRIFSVITFLDKLTGYWNLAEGFKILIMEGSSSDLAESILNLIYGQIRIIEQKGNNISNYIDLLGQQSIELQSITELIK